jgi:hypothetical protein
MADTLKTIRVIPFSGKGEDWNRWSKTFLATATAKGYRDILKPEDPNAEIDVNLNIQAYNDLILSCQEEITFGIVDESVSEEFPDGDARLAWSNLQDKFEPLTGAAKVQTKLEFHQLKLSSADEDPDPWMTNLELKRRRLKTLGTIIDDDDLILHILNNLPKEYETVVQLCEEDLTRGNADLQVVKDRIRARFNRILKANEASDEAIALMTKSQFKGACTVCGKIGHKGADCFTLEKNKDKKEAFFKRLKEKRNKSNHKYNRNKKFGNHKQNNGNSDQDTSMAMTNLDEEMILIAPNEPALFNNFTWIADSGATTHMTNNLDGMFDLQDANMNISVGDGRKMTTSKIGKWKGTAIDKEGNRKIVTLTNVSYVPELMVNLFSLTAAMDKGFSIAGSKEGITLNKDDWSLLFDKKVGTPRGHVFGTTMIPNGTEMAQVNLTVGYKQAHEILGHPGRNKLLGTTERLKWPIGEKSVIECEACLKGKAHRLKMNKEAKNKASQAGERIMIDISSVKNKDNKKCGRFWLLIVDEATDMKWSYFVKSKSSQVGVLLSFIRGMMNDGKKIKFIRCDNAGENESLKQKTEEEGMNIKFEFTARKTPQQNGKVERAFATLYGRMRAMMAGAKWNEEMKNKYWMEAAATATKLDNILNEKGEPSPYEKFYNKSPDFEKHLRTFGELGVVTINPGQGIKAKLADRGTTCMFVGYPRDHAGNVYRMLNLQTKKILVTRDVKWLNTFSVNNSQGNTETTVDDANDDEEEHQRLPDMNHVQPERNENVPAPNMVNQDEPRRLLRELRGLEPFNRPGRLEMEGESNQLCFFVPDVNENDDTPTTFQEAWNHSDPKEREYWRAAIRLEFRQMLKNGVWRGKKFLNTLPSNRKGIGSKWVFKKKKNGVYRARLVVKGYDQVAGVDYQYNFAPVTSEVTLRILLILWAIEDYYAEVADVQTAFLYGDLEEELFIKIPPGYEEFLQEETGEHVDGKYMKLEKSTYGLVQAARSWWKKFTSILKRELGFTQYENDSCLLKRFNDDGKVFLIVYVDDCFVVGDEKAVKKALDDIEKHFSITRSKHIEDFIGCRIEREGQQILLSQPDLIKKMLRKFEEKISGMKDYETPAPASTHLVRCATEEEVLDEDNQKEFRSGVGSLLYLLKHSRPELSNSVRELSKVMDRANKAHEKALYRVIKFVEQTRQRRLVLSPTCENFTWDLKAYSDSDFAGDTETRKSVSGFIIYLCGAAISWRSKGQKSVSLSSTEAEYMAISEVAMEILYIVGILKFLGVKLSYPIEVNVDNIGAVYLSKNATTSNRTKHIDTRYHFVREYIEDGIVKVVFVRSEANDADIFTKNLNGDTFKKHAKAIGLQDFNEETTPKMGNRKGVEIGGIVFPTCD